MYKHIIYFYGNISFHLHLRYLRRSLKSFHVEIERYKMIFSELKL